MTRVLLLTANIVFGMPPDEVDHAALREAARAAQILNFIESELPLKVG
jgi:hypothetical protein